ncbi:DNA-directed RNA polymerase subunit delta [Alkalihalophilus sp. As8PL]|uniref:Probable DNA-directed RNA polymerase subunit delta n=1 Tax=Alkalihalophilus sp. As8PL TaxID=3237103 RepID=A0AB39BNW0_9BACI
MCTLNLKEMKKDELQELSMIEVTYALMKEKRKPYNFNDLVKEIVQIKQMTKKDVNERISFLYTDLNIDGRFLTLGDNNWGLKSWYPHEQSEEEITAPVNPRKKTAKEEEDDLMVDGFDGFDDEFEDLEDELDEISNEEDADEEDDTDDTFTEKDDLDGFDDDDSEDDLEEEEE